MEGVVLCRPANDAQSFACSLVHGAFVRYGSCSGCCLIHYAIRTAVHYSLCVVSRRMCFALRFECCLVSRVSRTILRALPRVSQEPCHDNYVNVRRLSP